MKDSEKIIAWLKDRPLIKINKLEEMVGTSQGDVAKAIAGKRPLQERHIDNLKAIIVKYGYQ